MYSWVHFSRNWKKRVLQWRNKTVSLTYYYTLSKSRQAVHWADQMEAQKLGLLEKIKSQTLKE